MDDNIITLRQLQTPEQVLTHAAAMGLKHVVVAGITEDGENYFQATGQSTLREIVWIVFCAQDSAQRMVNGKP